MKNNISEILDSKVLKPQEKEKNNYMLREYTTASKKLVNSEKNFCVGNIICKTQTQKKKLGNHVCLTQNIKPNYDSKRIQKTKIKSINSFEKSPIESLKISKKKVVKKFFNSKKDIASYNTINGKKNITHRENINFNEDNEILYMPKYNYNKNNLIFSRNNIHESSKKERIIDISDNDDDDSLILNNDENNEENNVNNTIFPKLASNPFLTLNDKNNNLGEKNKLFFSPNIVNKKKGKCIQQTQLYYYNKNNNNLKSPTKTVISINSSTTQNSNDTINNINVYNLDTSKRKKINDLNSNSNKYAEREIYSDKNVDKYSQIQKISMIKKIIIILIIYLIFY